MNSSDNFGLNLPEQTDAYDVEHMNENTRAIDTLLNERMALKTITVDTDLNRMLESGIYYFPQNKTYTNMPLSCTNGWLIVMNNDGNVKQVFLRRGSASTHSNAYSRLLSGTGDLIGDWVRYLSELELGAFTNLDLDPQATDVVQALNDLYSYCVNQFANKNHTHNYAGSSSAGGSATSAVKLQNARTIRTNLQSTSTASFDGTANVTPGVTGVLPVANGGTGQTTLANSEKALLTSLSTSADALIEDGDYIPVLTQSGGGGVTSYIATKRSPSTFWDYIVDKIAVNLGLTASRYFGKSAGITGVLPVANGGTGTDTLSDAFQALSKSQDLITDQNINDEDRIMIEYEVIDNNYSFVRTSVAKLAEYVKNKIGNATTSVAGLMSANDKKKLDNSLWIDLKGNLDRTTSFPLVNITMGLYLVAFSNLYGDAGVYSFGVLFYYNNGYAGYNQITERHNNGSAYSISVNNGVVTSNRSIQTAKAIKIGYIDL